jgi:NAD(P)-dependent dehydrogenase (short-subunit alcohol dehydrogenase family)
MAEEPGLGSLAGKIAVVTGGTSGSGKAIVKRFAAEGATMFVLARGSDRLRQLAEDVEGDITGIPTDVADPRAVDAAFERIHDIHGKLDILINNAGVYRPSPIELLSNEDIQAHVGTNFLGPVHTCRAAIPLLRAAGSGDIVNTGSEATFQHPAMLTMYIATKAAVHAFSDLIMKELVDDDIRVTTLVQGVAYGEGAGSSDDWNPDHAARALPLWEAGGFMRPFLAGGQTVEAVADVHLFVVTRPRGQRLDTIYVRSY